MNKTTLLKYSLLALIGIALLFSFSCSREGGLDELIGEREVLFIVNSNSIVSKASPTTTSTITASPFGVVAYSYADGAAASSWTLHANSTVEYTSGSWIPTPRVYWPAKNQKVSYFAYWPKVDGNGISVTPASNAAPTATVTIKDGQVDFLTAKSENLEDNPDFTALNVTLSFSHALAGIRFKCNDGVTVESVTISGVNNKGTYSFTDNTWSGQEVSGANTYTLTGITYDAASDGYKTFKLEHTLFMLPQTLPAGSRIAVKIAGKSVVVEAGMVGHVWDSGKCITYLINSLPDGSVTLSIDSVTSFSNVASDITAGGGNVNEFNDDDDGILIW